jgi:hypothetical protein
MPDVNATIFDYYNNNSSSIKSTDNFDYKWAYLICAITGVCMVGTFLMAIWPRLKKCCGFSTQPKEIVPQHAPQRVALQLPAQPIILKQATYTPANTNAANKITITLPKVTNNEMRRPSFDKVTMV